MIRIGNVLWSSILKKRGHTKIIAYIKQALYSSVLHHPQAVQSPISNDCLKVSIYGQSETYILPKLLFKLSVGELHNSMVSPTEEGVTK